MHLEFHLVIQGEERNGKSEYAPIIAEWKTVI